MDVYTKGKLATFRKILLRLIKTTRKTNFFILKYFFLEKLKTMTILGFCKLSEKNHLDIYAHLIYSTRSKE